MNDYPAYNQLLSSSMVVLDDITVDRSASGTARSRYFYPAAKRQFAVVHLLDNTDLADLEAFYTANRALAVSFTWAKDDSVYTCLFSGPMKYAFPDPNWTQVTVTLEEQ